jgi:hypothetical protein
MMEVRDQDEKEATVCPGNNVMTYYAWLYANALEQSQIGEPFFRSGGIRGPQDIRTTLLQTIEPNEALLSRYDPTKSQSVCI